MNEVVIRADALSTYAWLNVPIWVFDKSRLRITWANSSALQFWDSPSLRDLERRDFSDITLIALERLATIHRNALKGFSTEEQWTLYPRGHPKQVVLKSAVVEEKDGTTDGILFCAANLQAVPDSQLRGVQVLSYTSTIVALYRLDGTVLFRNPAATSAWDDLSNIRGLDSLRATFINPQDATLIVNTIKKNERVFSEFKMLTAKQGERVFELDCRPLTDPLDAQLVLGMSGRDVTAYNQLKSEHDSLMERQVRSAQAAAKSEKELTIAARKVFMATASHEIRTPLQSIISSLDLLERYPHEIETCIFPMREAVQQLNEIAADLVEFVRADSTPGLRLRILHGATFLRKTLSQFQKQALVKGIDFTTEFEGLDTRIKIDEIRMRQVLTNLVGNAVKYTPAGAVRIHAMLRTQNILVVRITDTGVGMSETATSRVLQPFTRGKKSRLMNPQGLGLGLAIVQSHLIEMGGEMQIKSKLRIGTEINIYVPLQDLEIGSVELTTT